MKKQLLFLAILFFTSQTVNAQSPSRKKGYAGIKLGVGIPSGDFGDKSSSNPSSGFAQGGPCIDLNVAYKFIKYLGVAGMIRSNYYFLDQKAIANSYAKANPGYEVKVDYVLSFGGMYMAGLYGSVPLDANERVSLDTRFLGGFGYAFLPSQHVTGYDNQTGESFTLNRDAAFAFSPAYLLGIGLRFNMGRFMAVLFNVDYTGANFYVNNQQTKYNSSILGASYTKDDTYRISYGCVNITAGAAFRFGKEKTPSKAE
jgi:hypothetical protein